MPHGNILKSFLPLGISSFPTLVNYGALSKYGPDIPLTVVGVVMKVFQIVISFVVGIAAGCQPIVGYNYGAGHMDRVKQLYKVMSLAIIVIGIVSTLAFELFPVQIIRLFGSEGELYNEFAALSFRIYLSTVLLCCLQKASSIFLQSLGKPVLSMTVSLLRDFVLIVPFVLVLPHVMNLGVIGPLFAAPAADAIAFLITAVMMLSVLRGIAPRRTA